MNDMLIFGGIFACVLGCMLGFALFHIYSGVHGSLANAKVGEVYNFEYLQPHHGDPVRVLARVVEPAYTLSDECIRRLNSTSNYRNNDPEFKRTRHLVTCETPNGDIRQFYAERAKNVRRPLLAGLLFKTGTAHLFA
jgi:hypothetical protein